MTEYHHLLGADDVLRASHNFQAAADHLRQSLEWFCEESRALRAALEEDRRVRQEWRDQDAQRRAEEPLDPQSDLTQLLWDWVEENRLRPGLGGGT